ncbi:hypothetical protein AA0229_0297 [Gluconobacter cerinus NRIC 0229]|nr:hypothetical protein AA0229_0297 [Gluconobacter cerinus NRIC 0229]
MHQPGKAFLKFLKAEGIMVLHAFNSGVQNTAFSQNLKMMGHAGLWARPDQGGTIRLAQNI